MSGTEDTPLTFPPGAGISASQRLWSEETGAALAQQGEPFDTREPSYEFSNGRRFLAPGQ